MNFNNLGAPQMPATNLLAYIFQMKTNQH